MKKRLISLSACLCLIAQFFVVSASAEQNASVLSSEIKDGIATVVFSEGLNESAKGNITVQDENGNDVTSDVSFTINNATLTADVTALPASDGEYKISLPQALGLASETEVAITRQGGEGFEDDCSSTVKWCSVGSYNASMSTKPVTSAWYYPPAAANGGIKVEKFTAPVDFPSNVYSNETLEFDYSFMNTMATNCDDYFAALIRCEDVYGTSDYQKAPYAKAYALHLMNNGSTTVARLLRIDSEDVQYIWSSWSDRMQWANANLDLQPNTPVRFKLTTKNTDAGVTIAVYMAEYTDGVLGEYKKLMQGTDALSKYQSGYMSFVGNANPGSVIKNVKLSTELTETIAVRSVNVHILPYQADETVAGSFSDKGFYNSETGIPDEDSLGVIRYVVNVKPVGVNLESVGLEASLSEDLENSKKITTTQLPQLDDVTIEFSVDVSNIPFSKWNTPVFGRGFATYSDKTVVSDNVLSMSVGSTPKWVGGLDGYQSKIYE